MQAPLSWQGEFVAPFVHTNKRGAGLACQLGLAPEAASYPAPLDGALALRFLGPRIGPKAQMMASQTQFRFYDVTFGTSQILFRRREASSTRGGGWGGGGVSPPAEKARCPCAHGCLHSPRAAGLPQSVRSGLYSGSVFSESDCFN